MVSMERLCFKESIDVPNIEIGLDAAKIMTVELVGRLVARILKGCQRLILM